MSKRNLVLAGLAALGLAAASLAVLNGNRGEGEPPQAAAPAAGAAPRTPTLYCQFYNFVGRSPKVGFTFAVTGSAERPVFAQINQLEMDGTRAEFGADGSRPVWTFREAEAPATLTSPDGAIGINLYGYDGPRTGTAWFEAGLRSVQYLNLDGQCRRGTA